MKNKTIVILLTHNVLQYTIRCIESLYTNIGTSEFDLMVVDNNSSDGTQAYLDWLEREKCTISTDGEDGHQVYIIKNNENKCFSEGMNTAFRYLRNNKLDYKYILQLNNDTLVPKLMLKSFILGLNLSEDVGMVGPLSNYVGGNQAVPVKKFEELTVGGFNEYSMKFRSEMSSAGYRNTGILVGLCIMFKKECLDDIGEYPTELVMFDDNWASAVAMHKGWKLKIDPSVLLWHFGSMSFKAGGIDMAKAHIESQSKFLKLWGNYSREKLDYKTYEEKWDKILGGVQ